MKFSSLEVFEKELLRLSKKYTSLPEDMAVFKRVVSAFPCGTGKNFVLLSVDQGVKIIKARLACKYLKGSGKMRIVYAYHESADLIEFIELYVKSENVREDQQRIRRYLEAI